MYNWYQHTCNDKKRVNNKKEDATLQTCSGIMKYEEVSVHVVYTQNIVPATVLHKEKVSHETKHTQKASSHK